MLCRQLLHYLESNDNKKGLHIFNKDKMILNLSSCTGLNSECGTHGYGEPSVCYFCY
jgi:hypothetical protein